MEIRNSKPAFGGRLKTPDYYENLNSILRVLREHSTLRTIARTLNEQLLTTPSGKPWNRSRVSAYLKANDINSTNEKE
jgi:hypothetical protein